MNRDGAARSPVSLVVIRYSLLAVAIIAATASAQPLQFGPAARVAPFSAGARGADYGGKVVPRVNGFTSYWLHYGELWSELLSGLPARPELATARSLGDFDLDYAETVNGPIVLDGEANGPSAWVRLINQPQAQTSFSGFADAIECNSTRCLVSLDNGNTLAVVDTNAQLVKLLPRAPVAGMRWAWATDPDGFLVLYDNEAISIDNSGNVRADVKIDQVRSVAATFNGDRYAVFDRTGAGVTAFTMTVDGQLSSTKTVTTAPMLPEVVGWNGNEYLLVGPPYLVGSVPEVVPANSLSGLRVATDLTPIGTQPFQIAPSNGANTATSLAWNGSMFYVVWTHTAGSLSAPPALINSTVDGAAISATGDVAARDLLAWGSLPQTWPHVARGNQPIVVWSEFDLESGTAALRYEISGQAFTVATGFAMDVVPLGQDYLVAWEDAGRAHAAILTSDLKWSELTLPPFDDGSIAVAANHDHWLIGGTTSPDLVTVAISRDGTVSPPKVVAQLPYLLGLASDGDRFFLAARDHDFILDGTGSPLLDKQPHFGATQVDFADGVYGALGGGTFDRYDRDGNFIGSTKYGAFTGHPTLSHIGSRFVIVDSDTKTAAIIASDGTLLARDIPVPAVTIARTDALASTAVETHSVTDSAGRQTAALFVESVSVGPGAPRRAVKH